VQTFLDFHSESNDLILSNKNLIILNLLEANNQFNLICGSSKSGKSTIAKKFSKKNSFGYSEMLPRSLEFQNGLYLDLNELPLADEFFFHFLQYYLSQNLHLTIFTQINPFELNSKVNVLPDTLSRLKQFNFEIIEEPDEELLFKLIEKHLKSKSITVPDRIIQETMNHINRTYLDAYIAAGTINHLLSQNNHNINLSLIKSHYEQI
jgi:hypothetical protein